MRDILRNMRGVPGTLEPRSHREDHMRNRPGGLKLYFLFEEPRVACLGRRGKGSGEMGLGKASGYVQ